MAWRGLVISDETRVVRQGRGHVVGPWPARRPRYGFLEVGWGVAPFQMAGLGTWIGGIRTGPARRTQGGAWASRSRLVDAVDALRSCQFLILLLFSLFIIFFYKE